MHQAYVGYSATASAAAALATAQEPVGLSVAPPVNVKAVGVATDSAQLQNLHQQVLSHGDSIAKSFGTEPTGFVKIISWMVRATFLDTRVARAAAQDVNGNGAAVAALAITALPGILIGTLVASGMGFRMNLLAGLLTTVIVTCATLLVTFFSLSAISAKIVDVKLSPATVMRVLAYPQTISAVNAIPLLGNLIGPIARIWTIVASAVGVREVTGTRTEKAVLFAAFGALIQACTWMVLSVLAARTAVALNIR